MKPTPGFHTIILRLKVMDQRIKLKSAFPEGVCKETSESYITNEHGVCWLTVPDSPDEYVILCLLKNAVADRKKHNCSQLFLVKRNMR